MLRVGDLAYCATVLWRDADRMLAFFREATAVADQHAVTFANVLRDQLFAARKHGLVIPSSFAEELLHGTNGIGVATSPCQDHWLDSLAFEVRELSLQVERGPLTLFSALLQISKVPVIGHQLFGQFLDMARREIARRFLPAGRHFHSRRAPCHLYFLNLFHHLLPKGFSFRENIKDQILVVVLSVSSLRLVLIVIIVVSIELLTHRLTSSP